MSKPRKSNIAVLLVSAGFILFPLFAQAQYLEAAIKLDAVTRTAFVEGKFLSGDERRSMSFLLSAIGAPDLGRRISNIRLTDQTGNAVGSRRLGSAEITAASAIAKFRYDVDLKPLVDVRSAAHASWLEGEVGMLMLDDLLPMPVSTEQKRAAVKIELPTGWQSYGASPRSGIYEIEDIGRAAIIVGKSLRFHPDNGKDPIGIAMSGIWSFPDKEAAEMTAEVYREYRSAFGADAAKDRLVVLLPFPQANVSKGTWEAETRGSTVIIASAEMPFKSQSLQRLHEQLRHEIFHLWVPNAVSLTGRYDWFYEGFALYQSLRTGVALNRIRFDDLLDTLSRAHNIDSAQTRKLSLIDASAARWAGHDTQVYARGMVTAFLCDLALLRDSGGKRSVGDLFRKVFAGHRHPATPEDGNNAILRVLDSHPELGPVVRAYVRGNEKYDWTAELAAAGIVIEAGPPPRLQVASKLTAKQKTLLDKLGYNSWRKLTRK